MLVPPQRARRPAARPRAPDRGRPGPRRRRDPRRHAPGPPPPQSIRGRRWLAEWHPSGARPGAPQRSIRRRGCRPPRPCRPARGGGGGPAPALPCAECCAGYSGVRRGTKARIQVIRVSRPRPNADFAPSAASPARWSPRPMASASGTGLWSGSPANGSAGRTGSSWWVVAVEARSVTSTARIPSDPVPAADGEDLLKVLDRLAGSHRGEGRLELVDADRVGEVPADQRDAVVGRQGTLPRVRLDLEGLAKGRGHPSPADPWVLLGHGRRGWDLVHSAVAHDDGARRTELGDVRLPRSDDDRHDAHAGAARDPEPLAAVVETSVGAGERSAQRHEDAGREVVVVVTLDGVERLARRLGQRRAPARQLGEQVEAPLRARGCTRPPARGRQRGRMRPAAAPRRTAVRSWLRSGCSWRPGCWWVDAGPIIGTGPLPLDQPIRPFRSAR